MLNWIATGYIVQPKSGGTKIAPLRGKDIERNEKEGAEPQTPVSDPERAEYWRLMSYVYKYHQVVQ